MVAVPEQHRSPSDSVRLDDLKDETLLLLEDGHCLRDQALEVCSRVVFTRSRISVPPAWRRCGRWWPPAPALRCCRSWPAGRLWQRARRGDAPVARPAPVRHVGCGVAQDERAAGGDRRAV